MIPHQVTNLYLRLLAISSACIFAGRAYNYFFWGSPIRVLLWDQDLFSPFVENVLRMTWEAYAANTQVSTYLDIMTKVGALFFLLCSLVSFLILFKRKTYLLSFLYIGSFVLVCHALLEMKDHFYHYAQFFEHSIQIGTPLLLGWAVFHPNRQQRTLSLAKILIALTFVAHGLYAMGFYPVPGHFIDMTISILGISEDQARLFLKVAGILDLILGVALFLPKIDRYALMYAVLWGFLTASARIVSGFEADFVATSLHVYACQTVFRLAHALTPLAALLLLKDMETK
ncbi:MAG: hypothetical protein AAF847_13545 [Bacteroidota bacterium]